MANVRGVGGMTGRNLVGTFLERTGEKGPYYLGDVQIDQRDTKSGPQANPHLEPGGNNRIPYTKGQVNKILEAGDSVKRKDGTIVFTAQASLMQTKPDKNGFRHLIIDTSKDIGKSEFGAPNNFTIHNQEKATEKVQAAAAASRAKTEKAAEVATPVAEIETPAVEVEA